jgi:hypothetical protein
LLPRGEALLKFVRVLVLILTIVAEGRRPKASGSRKKQDLDPQRKLFSKFQAC